MSTNAPQTQIKRLGKYRILAVVNTGQSTRMLKGYDDERREPVGIKTPLERLANDKSQIALLKWEHTVASKLSSPLLIGIHDYAWDAPTKMPFLVMEWFDAPNMKALINKGYGAYCNSLEMILSGMLGSMMYLHEQGLVHCDIKPDNFLFNEELGFKMIDFAIARKIPSGLSKLFGGRSKTQGTASYMSPEQIRGKAPDPRSDIYSLGCTFFELLACKLPFSGNSMNELLQKHLTTPPPSIAARNPNLTPEFGQVLRVMMAKKPEDRPASIKELVSMISNIRLFKREPNENDTQ
jgi:serine/threonine protein kinase